MTGPALCTSQLTNDRQCGRLLQIEAVPDGPPLLHCVACDKLAAYHRPADQDGVTFPAAWVR
jgi:hypothetical protein